MGANLDPEALVEQQLGSPAAGRSLVGRMIGAARFDIPTYEEVEHDPGATGQAAIVVGIVAVCAAIGEIGEGGGSIIAGLLSAYVGWLVWAGVTYLIGDKLLGGTATWGELLRTLGFAQSPGVLRVVGFVPLLGWLVAFAVWIWMLAAGIVAIRQALDFGTGKAILTAVLGLIAYVAAFWLLGLIFGVPAAVAG